MRALSEEDVMICDPGGTGLIFPIFEGENTWDKGRRAYMYGIMLLYCFLGVAIVADIFMTAIEKITSQERKVVMKVKGVEKPFYVRIWNPTIANLTLMALGSSAPEILLSVIELFGNGMYSGPLGPSTIVGSAAFNLLMIIAVCVVSIPSGETRAVKEVGVYVCTAIASLLAYLWLIMMLETFSPNVVEPWEGIVTFVAFPVLVLLSYLIDIGYFDRAHAKKHWTQAMIANHLLEAANTPAEEGSEMKLLDPSTLAFAEQKKYAAVHPEVVAMLVTEVTKDLHGAKVDASTLAELVSSKLEATMPKSRAYYRVKATRDLTGGKKVGKVAAAAWHKGGAAISVAAGGLFKYTRLLEQVSPSAMEGGGVAAEGSAAVEPVIIGVACDKYVFRENCRTAVIRVVREGNLELSATVDFETQKGTARPGEDYKDVKGKLAFAPHVTTQDIEITILDDENVEGDENFRLVLSSPTVPGASGNASGKKGGGSKGGAGAELAAGRELCHITIVDDDAYGQLRFATTSVRALESEPAVAVTVERVHGSTGTVSCTYSTVDGAAVASADFVPTSGTLTFHHGEASRVIKIPLIDDGHYEKDETFSIVLSAARGGATFENGGSTDTCAVTIKSDDKKRKRIDEIAALVTVPANAMSSLHELSAGSWAEQFREALSVNGGDDDPDTPPVASDYAMHLVCLPWKLFFAAIPPADYCGGILAFVISLVFIGVVTAVIGDIASLFGCVLGLPDAITAITFVAMGTSLPDTFASMTAAVNDATADASIVNVTGSNAVNVFLGLGLPWMLGALYWHNLGATAEWQARYPDLVAAYPNGGFVVRSGDLSFSVGVFCTCATLCFVVLAFRRACLGYELGGSAGGKWLTGSFLALLWLTYIGASIASVMGWLPPLPSK